MNYSQQLKSPKWQKKRLEILERDNFTCTNCGSEEDTLHVHHYLYEKNLKAWEYKNQYLTTFCDNCHRDWHLYNNLIKENLCIDVDSLSEIYAITSLLKDLNPVQIMRIRKITEEALKLI